MSHVTCHLPRMQTPYTALHTLCTVWTHTWGKSVIVTDRGYLGKVLSCVHFEEKGRNFVLFLHRICHDRIPILLLAYYRMILL